MIDVEVNMSNWSCTVDLFKKTNLRFHVCEKSTKYYIISKIELFKGHKLISGEIFTDMCQLSGLSYFWQIYNVPTIIVDTFFFLIQFFQLWHSGIWTSWLNLARSKK